MRHGTCFHHRLSAHHAGAAPHSAVAELGVVRRRYTLTVNHISRIASSTIPLAWIVCFAFTACESKPSQTKEIAWKATERFHQEFNDPSLRDFHVVHGISGHPEIIPHPQPADIREARATLGLFESATLERYSTSFQKGGIDVTLTLHSQFERGTATEKISFFVTGGTANIKGYSIESPLLRAQ